MLHQTRDVASRVLSQGNLITALCTYALARVAALRNRRSEATLLLEEALDHGLDPPTAQAIGKEQDFKLLQSDPKFEAILLRIDRQGNHGKGRAQGEN